MLADCARLCWVVGCLFCCRCRQISEKPGRRAVRFKTNRWKFCALCQAPRRVVCPYSILLQLPTRRASFRGSLRALCIPHLHNLPGPFGLQVRTQTMQAQQTRATAAPPGFRFEGGGTFQEVGLVEGPGGWSPRTPENFRKFIKIS